MTIIASAFGQRCRSLILLGCLLLIGAVGCSVSPQQELQMGLQAHPQFEQEFGGPLENQQIQQYTQRLGESLAKHAGRPDMVWQFRVLKSDQINAFALPGGYIYITSGLLFQLQNEAQFAGILGHEVGHIEHRHSARQMERAQLAQGGTLLAAVFGGSNAADAAGLVSSLALMTYGRDQEREADMAGLRYMAANGINPRGLVQAMRVIRDASAGGRKQPEFLSTHPDPQNRIEYLKQTIAEQYPQAGETGTFGEESFQQNVLRFAFQHPQPLPSLHPLAWCGLCQQGHAIEQAQQSLKTDHKNAAPHK